MSSLVPLFILALAPALALAQSSTAECIQDYGDLYYSQWRFSPGANFHYANGTDDLPEKFRGRLRISSGIFYFSPTFYTQTLYRDGNWGLLNNTNTFLYLKYYAHSESTWSNTTNQFFAGFTNTDNSTGNGNGTEGLIPAKDFTWKETVVQVNLSLGPPLVGFGYNTFQDYFFIDTLILIQSPNPNITLPEIKQRCPSKAPPYPTECIDTQEDFQNNSWLSYPTHSYAGNASSLPEDLELNLNQTWNGSDTGVGFFYFQGSPLYPRQVFFKDYSSLLYWDEVPTYLYVKYLSVTRAKPGNNSNNNCSKKVIYSQPAEGCPEKVTRFLPLNEEGNFSWNSELLEVKVNTEATRNLVEIGVDNFETGDIFIVEKIVLVRSGNYTGVLDELRKCLGN